MLAYGYIWPLYYIYPAARADEGEVDASSRASPRAPGTSEQFHECVPNYVLKSEWVNLSSKAKPRLCLAYHPFLCQLFRREPVPTKSTNSIANFHWQQVPACSKFPHYLAVSFVHAAHQGQGSSEWNLLLRSERGHARPLLRVSLVDADVGC